MNRNELANAITDYSHTLTSKALAVVGGTSAVSHTKAGDWLANTFDWFINWPWLETLSTIAVIMLIIERGFILWAWRNKYKRGEL